MNGRIILFGKQIEQITKDKATAANGRFGAMAAVTRRQYCGNLHVITPQEVRWKPPLPQAAGTLCDTRRKQR